MTDLFFVIGLLSIIMKIRKMKKTERYPYVVLLGWLGMSLWAGIITKNVTINRINIIFYPVIVISGIGIAWCIRKIQLLCVPIAAMYGVLALLMAQMYFGSWAELSRTYYYDPYLQALEYAKTIDCDKYYIYPDPQGIDAGARLGEILTMIGFMWWSENEKCRRFQEYSTLKNKMVLQHMNRTTEESPPTATQGTIPEVSRTATA